MKRFGAIVIGCGKGREDALSHPHGVDEDVG